MKPLSWPTGLSCSPGLSALSTCAIRVEYERLVGYGVFGEDERLELLDGHLVVCEPHGSRHSAALVALHQALTEALVQLNGVVRSQTDIDKAVQVARGVAGVKSVKNDMRIK